MPSTHRRGLGALAAILLLATAAPAHATQLDPRDPPTVSGPLSPAGRVCSKETQKSGGKVVAVFRLCQYLYLFDPSKETNHNKDFGALWVQTSVNAVNGWCTQRVNSDLKLPDHGVLSKTPKPGFDKEIDTKNESLRTKLTVDGHDNTNTPGAIKNTYVARRGELKAIHKPNRNLYRLRWNGNVAKTTTFALGAELQWNEGGSSPVITPRVSAQFLKGTC